MNTTFPAQNTFVKTPHIFIAGQGCYFPSLAEAITQNYSPNGIGLTIDTIEHEDTTWYQCHYTNVFD